MNWKHTAILGGLFAALVVAYFLYDTEPPGPEKPKFIIPDPEFISRVELVRPDEAKIVLERGTRKEWRVLPLDRPADHEVVGLMLANVRGFDRKGALDPAHATPSVTGLNPPRMTVSFKLRDRTEVVRFGNRPELNDRAVFYQVGDDPLVYQADAAIYESYNKEVDEIRYKKLAKYDMSRTIKVELEYRYTKAGPDGGTEKWERTVFENFEKGAERGWFMTHPRRERVVPDRVMKLVGGLTAMDVEEYGPPEGLEGKGLAPPRVKLAITFNGVEKPAVYHFGEPTGRVLKDIWVLDVNHDETARVKRDRFEQLPHQQNHFRWDIIYPFAKPEIVTFAVEAGELGKVLLERKEKKTGKPGEEVVQVVWEVLEPKGIRVERDAVERFVNAVLSYRITSFMGKQPDLKLWNLDPPDVQLGVKTRDGKEHRFDFGLKGVEGYLYKEGFDEVFGVEAGLVRKLLQLELNFRTGEMFSCRRSDLQEIWFEYGGELQMAERRYGLVYDGEKREWTLKPEEKYKDFEPDPDRVNEIMAGVNYIIAERYRMWRSDELTKKYKLSKGEAPAMLKIVWKGGPEGGTLIYISENFGRPTAPSYFARIEGSDIVFSIKGELVETLKQVPVK